MRDIIIRVMEKSDYDDVYELWTTIKGLGIRKIDDSRENIVRFIERNPGTSFVAECDGRIIGSILCGHDGRRGCFYHVCVLEEFRNKKIATKMAASSLDALKKEGINKVNLMAFVDNKTGNKFWQSLGWKIRDDINLYEYNLNEENVTEFNK